MHPVDGTSSASHKPSRRRARPDHRFSSKSRSPSKHRLGTGHSARQTPPPKALPFERTDHDPRCVVGAEELADAMQCSSDSEEFEDRLRELSEDIPALHATLDDVFLALGQMYQESKSALEEALDRANAMEGFIDFVHRNLKRNQRTLLIPVTPPKPRT
jgi:hypothetical protein